MFSKQLVVLAGGKGTRLGELAKDTPKPLMTIDKDKVFLDYLLENAVRQGFEDIVLLAGHHGQQVVDRYHGRRMAEARVSVITEQEPMGTGGALKRIQSRLDPTFITANGDTLFDINMRALDHSLQASPDLAAVLALRHVSDAGRYGQVLQREDGIITGFAEKNSELNGKPGIINGGIYALRKSALDALPEGYSSLEANLFPQLVQAGAVAGIGFNGYFLDIGLPETLRMARDELPRRLRPVLFLDRDGVINVEKNYLFRTEDFEWIDGAVRLIRRCNDQGRAVVVVTNQAGIARGKYLEEDAQRLHRHIQALLFEQGAFIDRVYYCPYHKEATVEKYRISDHPERKPNPGMLERAFAELPISRERALLIGDMPTDIAAAQAAGVRGVLFGGGNLSDFEQYLTPTN